MRSVLDHVRQLSAGLRMLLVLTVLCGVLYPLVVLAVAQLPGLSSRADGSVLTAAGKPVGSALLGQSFTDSAGDPLVQYFQSRPSAAGDGYDPTASGASNLGPESIVDTLPDPAVKGDTGTQSLLTRVCARSLAVGELEKVSGARPFCATVTSRDGHRTEAIGAVLAVFWSGPGYHGHVTKVVAVNESADFPPFTATYRGVPVQVMSSSDQDVSRGQLVPIRGAAPADPVVPSDAVTASGSGLDPEISLAYARLQQARVAGARHITVAQVAALVDQVRTGRDLGFIGEQKVNVLRLNLLLDARYPYRH